MDDSKPLVSLTKALSVIPSPDSIPPLGLPFSADEFISQSLWRPRGARGVFGGQVIAQALLSASHTVPKPLGLHSQHSYFLLPADAGIPILYTVERLRDGKSYATRLVRASQKRKVVFVLLASFALPPISLPPLKEGPSPPFGFIPTFSNPSPIVTQKQTNQEVLGLSHSLRFAVEPNPSTRPLLESRVVEPVFQKPHLSISVVPGYAERWQVPMPEGVMMWDECELEEKRWQRYLDDQGDELKDRGRAAVEEYIQERKESPIQIRVAKRRSLTEDGSTREDARNERSMWLRARLAPGEKPDTETVKAMIAYMTDFQFIGTASRSVGLSRTSSPRLGMLASLDHTTHFYPLPPDFDPATPLLHVMESAIADVRSGRGVVRGTLYTPQGVMVAATLQEGVVRADLGKAERGLVEGGGVVDVDDHKKGAKAKL